MTLIFSVYGRAGMSRGNFHREPLFARTSWPRLRDAVDAPPRVLPPGRWVESPNVFLEAVGGAKRAAPSCDASN